MTPAQIRKIVDAGFAQAMDGHLQRLADELTHLINCGYEPDEITVFIPLEPGDVHVVPLTMAVE